jgi:hypothetical protein
MSRVNIYAHPGEYGYDSEAKLAGWFDIAKAEHWTDRDCNGNGSGGTGRGQAVYRTSGGKWVLCNWSAWQGEDNRYEYIEAEDARDWLLRNDFDSAVTKYFGELAEEEDRRPGRPPVGEPVNVRLGDQQAAVDAYAAQNGQSRAEAVRELVSKALAS